MFDPLEKCAEADRRKESLNDPTEANDVVREVRNKITWLEASATNWVGVNGGNLVRASHPESRWHDC